MFIKFPKTIFRIFKTTNFWRQNVFILGEFKYFWKILAAALVFSFLAAAFEGFGVGFILSFLQSLTTPNASPMQTGISWIDISILGINSSPIERIYRISLLILITTLLRSGFTYLGNVFSEISQAKLTDRLRKRIFEQFEGISLSYFSKTRSGELVHVITTELTQIQQVFSIVFYLIARSSTLIVYVIAMLMLSWQLSILSIVLFSLLTAALTNLIKRVREASFAMSKAGGNYTATALEFINGIRTVQASGTYEFERDRHHKASSTVVQTATRTISFGASIEPIAEGVATTILIGMIILAFSTLIPNGQLQTASLLTFLFVLFRLMPIVRQVNGARTEVSRYYGAISNVKQLLSPENKTYLKNGKIPFTNLKKAIEFVSVDFGYSPENLVLHNITLTINKGQMTALVGSSGAGKTTLADLIPRFYDLTEGQILIDGVDLQQFEINSWRHRMAIVSQDTFIFNTSIRNNIAYGTESADEAAIIEAARLANALDFIQEMPEGFDTQLGDRGVRLSGGQRQRIAIARALLRNPEILILDEATSALDSVTERLIQESLEKLFVGRTVIAIAHRLSTIIRADKVVVLEQGRIVEQGGYQELLEQRGRLWKYHQMQHEFGEVGSC